MKTDVSLTIKKEHEINSASSRNVSSRQNREKKTFAHFERRRFSRRRRLLFFFFGLGGWGTGHVIREEPMRVAISIAVRRIVDASPAAAIAINSSFRDDTDGWRRPIKSLENRPVAMATGAGFRIAPRPSTSPSQIRRLRNRSTSAEAAIHQGGK